MPRLGAAVLALLAFAPPARAQPTLFPDLAGGALRQALVSAYAPVQVLSDAASKDTLYAVVDRVTVGGQDGTLGIYTGYFVPFDCNPSCDPSQDVFNDAAGINQEHTWPRSEGADSGNAERDLHHLFPSRVVVNSDRASLPFGESDDGATTAWYYLDQTQSTVPPLTTRDLWSERQGTTRFEPREEKKGDVARAIFYFYTIYGPEGTGQASPSFFEGMRDTLLAWHEADPPSAADEARSLRVASYQTTGSGEPAINPFVHDATLVRRAYFESASVALTVLLQGACDASGSMRAELSAVLPETDPYGLGQSVAPGFFTTDPTGRRVVDWLRLELRTGDPLSSTSVAAERAALLLDDGTAVGTDGIAPVSFPGMAPGTYTVAVVHRNHLAVMTPMLLNLSPTAPHDFTSGPAQAYGGPGSQVQALGMGWAMWAADGNADGQVTAPDFNLYGAATAGGATGYAQADYTLDGQVTAPDFNLYSAATAAGATSAVPSADGLLRYAGTPGKEPRRRRSRGYARGWALLDSNQ